MRLTRQGRRRTVATRGTAEAGHLRVTIFLRRLYHAIGDLHWSVLLAILVVHMGVSWLLLHLVGEPDLEAPTAFLYWYATTASTVGYGDLSPKSGAGRMVVAFFVFPGAIAAFTTVIAKTLSGLSGTLRRRRTGQGDYRGMSRATVLVGYDPDRTPRMIEEIIADPEIDQQIVLVATQALDNDDERYRYVHARSLTAHADLRRAGIARADEVVVFAANDAETLAAGLAVAALAERAHIVCFFQHEENARLLTAHCPEVEVVLAPSVELVVKAIKDPGSSHLLAQLVSHTDAGATLYSMPATTPGSFRETAQRLMAQGAVLLATAPATAQREIRFSVDAHIAPGDRLFYVARERLPEKGAAAA